MTTFSTTTFAVALLAATMLTSFAQAAENGVTAGPYLSGQVGYNHPVGDDDTLDNSASFSGAVGYRFNPNVCLEGEVSYRKNDFGTDLDLGNGPFDFSGDTKVTTFMANAFYDFANASAFTPYIGGGLGLAHGTAQASGSDGVFVVDADESDNAFVYQLAAGVSYDLTNQFAVTADYRYLDTATFDDIGDDYRAHEIRAGARYTF